MRRIGPLLAAPLLLAACASRPADLPPGIPLPAPPTLPAVTAGDVACLTDASWRKLVLRDALLRAHARDLRAILEALTTRPPLP